MPDATTSNTNLSSKNISSLSKDLIAYLAIPLGSVVATFFFIFILSLGFCDSQSCESPTTTIIAVVVLFSFLTFFGSLLVSNSWKKGLIGLIIYLGLSAFVYFVVFAQPIKPKIQN